LNELDKGDRVLLLADNSFFWVASYLGILRAGLVCVPLPPAISFEEFSYNPSVTGARVAFAEVRHARQHFKTLHDRHVVTDAPLGAPPSQFKSLQTFAGLEGDPDHRELPSIGPDDLAALMFTSGSTGTPKGVMVSHGNIVANAESIVQYLRLTERDSVLSVLPFHYCYGTSLLHTHLLAGGSLVVDSRFMYPELILDRLATSECSGFAGVPSHFQILLRRSTIRKRSFPHLRVIQQAGGRLAPAFINELREALPDTKIFVMYGQTEATSRLSYLPPEFLDSKPGSIGRGMPGVKLRVLNEAGLAVRPGEIGEIVAEGRNIAGGYWGSPQESAETFREGRLHTGDLATVDDDDFIYIVDRAKDFLKCRGERVSCQKLEEQLLMFEDLLEVAVVGIPDDVLGEAVKAFVVSRRPVQDLPERLSAFCRTRMPGHLCPKEIVVLDVLPKNPAGKVMKATLRSR
jgi:acyl-CoA synthetase (AMP-forming)/AMP-acid ligase II